MTILVAPVEIVKETIHKYRNFNIASANQDKKFAELNKKWLEDHDFELKYMDNEEYILDYKGNNSKVSIISLAMDRCRARQEKDWSKADKIRNQLLEIGIKLLDKENFETKIEISF